MIPELESYYLTNYSKCKLSYNYLATWRGLAYPIHTIQVIAAPIQIFTFYIILKKTPKTMKAMKLPLLINHFCCTWFDFTICTLSTPYVFLPTLTFLGIGVLSSLGLPYTPQMVFGVVSAMSFCSSYVYLFENRSNALTDNRFRMKRKCSRILYHSIFLFIYLTLVLFMFFTTTEESQKLEALKIDPCPTREFFQFSLVLLVADSTIRTFTLFLWLPVLLFQMSGNAVFHILCSIYYLFLAPPSKSLSSETRRAQRHFLIGILIQTSIPLLTLLIPALVLEVLVSTDNYSQAVMNLGVIIFQLNGLVESLAILSLYRPYRNAVKEIMFFKKLKESKIQTIPTREVCGSSVFGRTTIQILGIFSIFQKSLFETFLKGTKK